MPAAAGADSGALSVQKSLPAVEMERHWLFLLSDRYCRANSLTHAGSDGQFHYTLNLPLALKDSDEIVALAGEVG
jgi:hypothetical protein